MEVDPPEGATGPEAIVPEEEPQMAPAEAAQAAAPPAEPDPQGHQL
jgi:hypothetical protein